MSTTKKVRGKQVSATVDPDLYKALEDYGWDNRTTRTDLVREAVEKYATELGIWPLPSPEDSGNDADQAAAHGD